MQHTETEVHDVRDVSDTTTQPTPHDMVVSSHALVMLELLCLSDLHSSMHPTCTQHTHTHTTS